MYPSTYLSWFRRLLILGAVVAGLTASAAGARLDPGTPPDVSCLPMSSTRYAAAHPYGARLPPPRRRPRESSSGTRPGSSRPAASLLGLVSTPPEVQDAMTALHSTPEGLKADGMRLQGIARTYMQLQSQDTGSQSTYPTWAHQLHSPFTASQYPTAAGLKADGLRYQGIARVYEQLQSNVPASGGPPTSPGTTGRSVSAPGSGLLSSSASDSWLVGSSATACSRPESSPPRTDRAGLRARSI